MDVPADDSIMMSERAEQCMRYSYINIKDTKLRSGISVIIQDMINAS